MGTRTFPTFGTQVNIPVRQVIYQDEMQGAMMEPSGEDIDIYPRKQPKAFPILYTKDIFRTEITI